MPEPMVPGITGTLDATAVAALTEAGHIAHTAVPVDAEFAAPRPLEEATR